jgi:predicted membrane protein
MEKYDIIGVIVLAIIIFLLLETFKNDPLGFFIFLLLYTLSYYVGSYLGSWLADVLKTNKKKK